MKQTIYKHTLHKHIIQVHIQTIRTQTIHKHIFLHTISRIYTGAYKHKDI